MYNSNSGVVVLGFNTIAFYFNYGEFATFSLFKESDGNRDLHS